MRTQIENRLHGQYPLTPLTKDAHLVKCFRKVEDAIKDKHLNVDSYVCTWIFAELKYPKEVVKSMVKEELVKQSTFYKEVLEEGMTLCREEGILSVLSVRFGPVSDQLSRRIHTLMERNGSLFDDLIKLAVTAKDISEFERKL